MPPPTPASCYLEGHECLVFFLGGISERDHHARGKLLRHDRLQPRSRSNPFKNSLLTATPMSSDSRQPAEVPVQAASAWSTTTATACFGLCRLAGRAAERDLAGRRAIPTRTSTPTAGTAGTIPNDVNFFNPDDAFIEGSPASRRSRRQNPPVSGRHARAPVAGAEPLHERGRRSPVRARPHDRDQFPESVPNHFGGAPTGSTGGGGLVQRSTRATATASPAVSAVSRKEEADNLTNFSQFGTTRVRRGEMRWDRIASRHRCHEERRPVIEHEPASARTIGDGGACGRGPARRPEAPSRWSSCWSCWRSSASSWRSSRWRPPIRASTRPTPAPRVGPDRQAGGQAVADRIDALGRTSAPTLIPAHECARRRRISTAGTNVPSQQRAYR